MEVALLGIEELKELEESKKKAEAETEAAAAGGAAGAAVPEDTAATAAAAAAKSKAADEEGEERRKAKVLNFSIAYGKTAFGLAKDWEISHAEAERTVELWYGDRPEVQLWQERTKEQARRTRRVYTILGRHRDLPDINTRLLKAHSERAAINTPIQGSAADIVMCAMLKVWRCAELAELGFRMQLQVHDELILEGPEANAPRAMERVVELMSRPFDKPLLVDLVVDAKVVTDWGSAK
jgi:DNA polymerase-1